MPKIIAKRRGAIFEIRLNRPELPNAVDRETIAELAAAAAEAAEDGEAYARTKALIQASLGDAFDAQLRREAKNCAATNDFAEGVRILLESATPPSPNQASRVRH